MARLPAFAIGLVFVAGACGSPSTMAAKLRRSTTPENLPKVVACWERAFEGAGFRGEFLATVDFTVGEDGSLDDVEVQSLEDVASGDLITVASDLDELRSCVEEALEDSRLPQVDFSRPIRVFGYRIGFADGSAEARAAAEEQAPTVLIGPRSDRCAGLYSHEPPRDAMTLQRELSDATDDVERAGDDRDRRARALQKRYDLALELIARLEVDEDDPGLAKISRKRIAKEIDRTRAIVREVGRRIGCGA